MGATRLLYCIAKCIVLVYMLLLTFTTVSCSEIRRLRGEPTASAILTRGEWKKLCTTCTENVAVSAADTVQCFSKDRFRRSVRLPLHSTAPHSQTFVLQFLQFPCHWLWQ